MFGALFWYSIVLKRTHSIVTKVENMHGNDFKQIKNILAEPQSGLAIKKGCF